MLLTFRLDVRTFCIRLRRATAVRCLEEREIHQLGLASGHCQAEVAYPRYAPGADSQDPSYSLPL